MANYLPILLSCAAIIGCRAELPTEPVTRQADLVSASFDDGGATLRPQLITIAVGQTYTATAAVKYSPALLPWTISSSNPGVAIAEGYIPAGSSSSAVVIRGVSPGHAYVRYSVPSFGRANNSYDIGVITVTEGPIENPVPPVPPDSPTVVPPVQPPCSAPTISFPPQNQTVRAGQRATLKVQPAGAPSYAYQWFAQELGSPAVMAASHTEVLVTEPLFRSSRFWVRVSSPCSSVVTDPALITVLPVRSRASRR